MNVIEYDRQHWHATNAEIAAVLSIECLGFKPKHRVPYPARWQGENAWVLDQESNWWVTFSPDELTFVVATRNTSIGTDAFNTKLLELPYNVTRLGKQP